jgi:hypothetical protein
MRAFQSSVLVLALSAAAMAGSDDAFGLGLNDDAQPDADDSGASCTVHVSEAECKADTACKWESQSNDDGGMFFFCTDDLNDPDGVGKLGAFVFLSTQSRHFLTCAHVLEKHLCIHTGSGG